MVICNGISISLYLSISLSISLYIYKKKKKKKKVWHIALNLEPQQDRIKDNWTSSGTTEHTKEQRVPWTVQLDSPKNDRRNTKHAQKEGA